MLETPGSSWIDNIGVVIIFPNEASEFSEALGLKLSCNFCFRLRICPILNLPEASHEATEDSELDIENEVTFVACN